MDIDVELRDYFAAAALQGMMANAQFMTFANNVHAAEPDRMDAWLADKAYRLAHAMLVERDL
jgi:hypothetical protein